MRVFSKYKMKQNIYIGIVSATPQGVLPILTIEGEGIDGKARIVQSNAIARCIARQYSKCRTCYVIAAYTNEDIYKH